MIGFFVHPSYSQQQIHRWKKSHTPHITFGNNFPTNLAAFVSSPGCTIAQNGRFSLAWNYPPFPGEKKKEQKIPVTKWFTCNFVVLYWVPLRITLKWWYENKPTTPKHRTDVVSVEGWNPWIFHCRIFASMCSLWSSHAIYKLWWNIGFGGSRHHMYIYIYILVWSFYSFKYVPYPFPTNFQRFFRPYIERQHCWTGLYGFRMTLQKNQNLCLEQNGKNGWEKQPQTFSQRLFQHTPGAHLIGNPPTQLWKDSLDNLLVKVKGCVPKVCWNNLRFTSKEWRHVVFADHVLAYNMW